MGGDDESTTSSIDKEIGAQGTPATARAARRKLTKGDIERISTEYADALERRIISMLGAVNGKVADLPRGFLLKFVALGDLPASAADEASAVAMDEQEIARVAADCRKDLKESLGKALAKAGTIEIKEIKLLEDLFEEKEVHILTSIPSFFLSPF